MSYIAYPTRRAVPVAPVPFGGRNTTRLLSFARLALLNRPAGPSPSQAMTRRTAGRPRPLSLEPPGYPSPSCLDRLHDAGSLSRHAPAATLPHRVGLPLFRVRSSALAPVPQKHGLPAGRACMGEPVSRRRSVGHPPLASLRRLSCRHHAA